MMGRNSFHLNTLIICCNLLFIANNKNADAGVLLDVKFLNYSNPTGRSWDGLNYNGTRKKCDVNSACDTYINFCLQIEGRCNSDISTLSETNNKHYPNQSSIADLSHDYHWHNVINGWSGGTIKFLIKPFDDDGASDDLIDILDMNYELIPGTITSPKVYHIQLRNRTTLNMEIQISCTIPGFYGKGCSFSCHNNPYIHCDRSGALICTGLEPTIARFNLPTSEVLLKYEFQKFLSHRVCQENVTLTNTIFIYNNYWFTMTCGSSRPSAMKFHSAIATLGYGGSFRPIRQTIYGFTHSVPVDVIFSFRVVVFENADKRASNTTTKYRKCCDSDTSSSNCDVPDTCDTYFRICLSRPPDIEGYCIETETKQDVNIFKACGDAVLAGNEIISIENSYIGVAERWNWNETYINIEVRDNDGDGNYDVIDTFSQKYDIRPGTSLVTAKPYTVSFHQSVRMSLQILAWCGHYQYGENCEVHCQDGEHKKCEMGTGNAVCDKGWEGKNCEENIDECSLYNPCLNGATCNDTQGSYNCTCTAGWTGKNCEIDINECVLTPNICENGGNCSNSRGSYSCHCSPGWKGKSCDVNIDECQVQHPCENNATCYDTEGSYNCTCTAGWRGTNCETDIDECDVHNICYYPRAKCINLPGSYQCGCTQGWQGRHCSLDVNECNHIPCQHNGTCHNTIGTYNCGCTASWEGHNCDEDVDECRQHPNICDHGSCTNEVGNYTCNCFLGWKGVNCNEPLCLNGGIIISEDSQSRCQCPFGWHGRYCEHDIDECASKDTCENNGTCINGFGTYLCKCEHGWRGERCETDFNECSINPCVHGICENQDGGYTCHCDDGWSGMNCNLDIDECKLEPCHNNATCNNLQGTFNCSCEEGFSGYVCDTNIDECATLNVTCYNNGSCSDIVNGFICLCDRGFTGQFCEYNIDECSSNPCKNGICEDEIGQYSCKCFDGWRGKNCEYDVDECLESPCFNNATCKNMAGNYSCMCLNGFLGSNCEIDIDECQSDPCFNNGICLDLPGTYSCTCQDRYTGKQCDIINFCSYHPCHHGLCTIKNREFFCQCNNGWTGKSCENDINECSKNLCGLDSLCVNTEGGYKCLSCENTECVNNGTCVIENGIPKCLCSAGWTGNNCSLSDNCVDHKCDENMYCLSSEDGYTCHLKDFCEAHPCKNNGTCISGTTGYTCHCRNGWHGVNCSRFDYCSEMPCMMGSTCLSTGNATFTCLCTVDRTGRTCADTLDWCSSSPCYNNGKCQSRNWGYVCQCENGWMGRRCQYDIDECQMNYCPDNMKCLNSLGGFTCRNANFRRLMNKPKRSLLYANGWKRHSFAGKRTGKTVDITTDVVITMSNYKKFKYNETIILQQRVCPADLEAKIEVLEIEADASKGGAIVRTKMHCGHLEIPADQYWQKVSNLRDRR